MEEATTTAEQDTRPPVPEPDLSNLDPWLEKVVDTPSLSYETGKKEDGTPLPPEEQLKLTRDQLKTFADDHIKMRNHPREQMRNSALDDQGIKTNLVSSVRSGNLSKQFK